MIALQAFLELRRVICFWSAKGQSASSRLDDGEFAMRRYSQRTGIDAAFAVIPSRNDFAVIIYCDTLMPLHADRSRSGSRLR